ncbi:hypothetical protein GIY30_01940 [Gordonia sp. HNM0687]|uniref:Uncharacterized protein n=1 Tax=Gordonia mangrovi TaxID=2665643 RepID=A0A6L7GLK7_9ACTN|nr:hypothetical protein [Gordonia mangrovi]
MATATGTASASPRQPADLDFGSLGPGSLEGLDLGSLEGLPFGSLDGLFGPSPPVQQCNQQTKSGGEGVTETRHILGRTGPTAFTLDYETVNQPDEIKVFYQGRLVHNTGYVGDNLNEGTGSARVTLPPGAQNYVVVRVTGPEEGTVWEYTVHCPT